MTELADRLAGGVWGHLVGDAVGVPYEFLPAERVDDVVFRGGGIHGQPAGTWSDDGALMLALLDSLLRDRGGGEPRFDPHDQARRFMAWEGEGAYTPDGDGRFDIGRVRVGSRRIEATKDGYRGFSQLYDLTEDLVLDQPSGPNANIALDPDPGAGPNPPLPPGCGCGTAIAPLSIALAALARRRRA